MVLLKEKDRNLQGPLDKRCHALEAASRTPPRGAGGGGAGAPEGSR